MKKHAKKAEERSTWKLQSRKRVTKLFSQTKRLSFFSFVTMAVPEKATQKSTKGTKPPTQKSTPTITSTMRRTPVCYIGYYAAIVLALLALSVGAGRRADRLWLLFSCLFFSSPARDEISRCDCTTSIMSLCLLYS